MDSLNIDLKNNNWYILRQIAITITLFILVNLTIDRIFKISKQDVVYEYSNYNVFFIFLLIVLNLLLIIECFYWVRLLYVKIYSSFKNS